jgi:hypothetical protein
MLAERDTPAVRRVFADRLQHWLYQFYPQFPDLAERSERRILELGGSDVEMGGGKFRALLTPIIGWKGVRQLQSVLYRIGWRRVLEFKAKKRLSRFQ